MTSPPRISDLALGAALAVGVLYLVNCAALEAAAPALIASGEQGLVALIEAEAKRAGVPPSDPAYQQALAEAKLLAAEQAKANGATQKKLDAILAAMRAQKRCPSPVVTAAPVAPAVHPEVVAGPWDGGAEGGR